VPSRARLAYDGPIDVVVEGMRLRILSLADFTARHPEMAGPVNQTIPSYLVDPADPSRIKALRDTEPFDLGQSNPGRFKLPKGVADLQLRVIRDGDTFLIRSLDPEKPVAYAGGRRVEAFVVNVGGRFHAYVNRCVHQGTPLDLWPNDFFTEDGRLLICATHGALYTPETGACAGGPCHGGALTALPVRVEAGRVIVTVPADGQG
jgi:nitrite reductase/ring-hydroxylating ferredoxin subunit